MTRPPLSTPDAARRRFMVIQMVVLAAFAVVMIATATIMQRIDSPTHRWLYAAGPVAILILWAWEFFRMIRRDDEMMQVIHLRAVALSAGLVLLAASLWGILERLLQAPGLPNFLLLPAFAVVYSVAIIRFTSRR